MTVPLLEGAGGQHDSGSTRSDQQLSPTATTSTSAGSGRRDLVTLHVGEGVTIADEDLELLLVVVQTVLLAAWAYSEVMN